jgi:F-type H+-transporting ATPase subunit epsilon
MADTFKFELVTPERMLMSQDAARVVVPGMEGRFTVLPGHAPVISALRPGMIELTLTEARTASIFVRGGFAEVDAGHVTVLAERAWDVEQLDQATIASELQAAEAELAQAASDTARLAAVTAVEQLKALQR